MDCFTFAAGNVRTGRYVRTGRFVRTGRIVRTGRYVGDGILRSAQTYAPLTDLWYGVLWGILGSKLCEARIFAWFWRRFRREMVIFSVQTAPNGNVL